MKPLLLSCLVVYFCKYQVHSAKLPGPLVYVVTPSPRTPNIDEGRSAPFYYHNWMRKMDPPRNVTTTQTPDLIFAEFESGNKLKSIRNLLDKERIVPKTTLARPIYVPDETPSMSQDVNYELPPPTNVKEEKSTTSDMTDYFALYNDMYNVDSAPVYMPSTTPSTTTRTTTSSTTQAPAITSAQAPNVQNIWHIIDSQKYDEYSGKWEEVTNYEKDETTEAPQDEEKESEEGAMDDDNFALPGFGTNPGNGAENESRAIRTEPNIRFPYVNLKPFQMKTQKKPLLNTKSSSKKANNMYTSLDNFYDIKNPVRGEAQDIVPKARQPVDRYNPAQPYLPQPNYGSKSKQSSPSVTPMRAVANLVPPPSPPPPPISDDDFPTPTSYESFPPYSPNRPPPAPAPPPKPSMKYQPPDSDDSDSPTAPDSDGPIDIGYRYKPPSPPTQPFLPTAPPMSKPFGGYSYMKPPVMPDSPPGGGYSYDKPPMMPDSSQGAGYSYDKPPMADSSPDNDKPGFQGYHYSKPIPQDSPPSYGPELDHSYEPDYPELIYDNPHGMKGEKDMGMDMVPPPPPADMKPDMEHGPPEDDHGFPPDFHGGDLKFSHDFDDYHHHHHHHTTTTTTTETPRVNRYSYYYLGKKLYYLPLYFSVYFIIYVGALIIKAVLRHKIVYPNSWRPNDQTAGFFSKRSIDSYDLSNENLHEITGKVTHAIAEAGKKYLSQKKK